jgi:hypothetical protein
LGCAAVREEVASEILGIKLAWRVDGYHVGSIPRERDRIPGAHLVFRCRELDDGLFQFAEFVSAVTGNIGGLIEFGLAFPGARFGEAGTVFPLGILEIKSGFIAVFHAIHF